MTAGAGDKPSILVACTDRFPETVQTVPITKNGERRDVVMHLGPATKNRIGVPQLEPGDRVRISAELEVTHDSTIPGAADLVGVAYSYEPIINARLLLSRSASAEEAEPGRALLVGKPQRAVCKVAQHHTRIVFPVRELVIPKTGVPWDGPSHVNLVLSAHHPAAKAGQVLLIGQNEPKTRKEPAHAKGNQGRINVVRFRGKPAPRPKRLRTQKRVLEDVPIAKEAFVVYSVRLRDLKAGEQLVVRAKVPVRNSHGFPARVSTEIFLSDARGRARRRNPARHTFTSHGQLAKGNGTNCLPRSTYTTLKYGVGRVLKARPGDSHVNLTVTSSNPIRQAGEPGKTIRVKAGGFLEVKRYAAGALARDAPD